MLTPIHTLFPYIHPLHWVTQPLWQGVHTLVRKQPCSGKMASTHLLYTEQLYSESQYFRPGISTWAERSSHRLGTLAVKHLWGRLDPPFCLNFGSTLRTAKWSERRGNLSVFLGGGWCPLSEEDKREREIETCKQHMKRYSTSYITRIRKMHIKTTVRCHLISARMAKIKNKRKC